jgi:hypothetical protein
MRFEVFGGVGAGGFGDLFEGALGDDGAAGVAAFGAVTIADLGLRGLRSWKNPGRRFGRYCDRRCAPAWRVMAEML